MDPYYSPSLSLSKGEIWSEVDKLDEYRRRILIDYCGHYLLLIFLEKRFSLELRRMDKIIQLNYNSYIRIK